VTNKASKFRDGKLAQKWLLSASLLASILAQPGYATTCPNPSGKVLFNETFESGSLSNMDVSGSQTASVIRLKDCNHVAFFKLNKNLDSQNFSTASSKKLKLCNGRQANRIRFRVYFPDMKRDNSEDILFTLLSKKELDSGAEGGISLCLNNGQFIFKSNNKAIWCSGYCERRWYEFVVDCVLEEVKTKSCQKNDNSGYVNLRVNNCLVASTKGPNVDDNQERYVCIGISKPSWAASSGCRPQAGAQTRQVYFDDLQVVEYK
jgi:hypothetical protein